jgi:hypothetical protein
MGHQTAARDPPLGYQRDEALTWIRPRNTNVKSAVRQFFNHALDRDLVLRNHFRHLGASKRKRRVDHPDFQIITDEQYEQLRRYARESRRRLRADPRGRDDDLERRRCARGKIFGLHRAEVHMDTRMIHVRRQLDLSTTT